MLIMCTVEAFINAQLEAITNISSLSFSILFSFPRFSGVQTKMVSKQHIALAVVVVANEVVVCMCVCEGEGGATSVCLC